MLLLLELLTYCRQYCRCELFGQLLVENFEEKVVEDCDSVYSRK